MTYPTDEELEALAQYWTNQMAKAVMQDAMLAAEKFSETAAMLRACKGRARVKALEWLPVAGSSRVMEAEGFNQKHRVWKRADNSFWWQQYPTGDWIEAESEESAKAAAQADYERRILAVLEPAPDQGEWDAALEAASRVAERRSTDGLSDNHPYNNGWRRCAKITAAAIRALKKGQTNE